MARVLGGSDRNARRPVSRGSAGEPLRASVTRARPRVRLRVPIALKFTVFIALLVVAAMTWQAHTGVDASARQVERAINENGVSRATSVAALLEPEWLQDVSHRETLRTFLQRYVGDVRSGRIRDIVARSDALGGILASALDRFGYGGQRRTKPTPVTDAGAARAGVTVEEFEVDGVPVRAFTQDVRDASGARVGTVEVLLSAESIQETRDDLTAAMRQVLIASILLASAASFLLATFLTRTIRVLVKDIKQVSRGDLEHQTSVDSSDELGELGAAFNLMTSSLLAAQQAKVAQQALEHELQLATRIQEQLLPKSAPDVPGLDIAARYIPAKEVGGDYFDFVPIDDHHRGLVVADVSGKGVPASLIMTMTRSLLRLAACDRPSPAETLVQVNACLSPDMNPGMFVTAVYAVLDTRTREIRLVRAGHNAPLLFSARHGRVLRLAPKGIAIGLDKKGPLFRSQIEVQRFILRPHDVLVLYSDGIVEAKDKDGRDFGDDALETVLAAARAEPADRVAEAILDAVARHRRSAEQSDDITLIVARGLHGG